MNGEMLEGGLGNAHLNFDINDIVKHVTLDEAKEMLMNFIEEEN